MVSSVRWSAIEFWIGNQIPTPAKIPRNHSTGDKTASSSSLFFATGWETSAVSIATSKPAIPPNVHSYGPNGRHPEGVTELKPGVHPAPAGESLESTASYIDSPDRFTFNGGLNFA